MKRLIFLITALLLVTVVALPCEAVPFYPQGYYFVFWQWGGTWQDANKTAANTEDDLLCWAAAAANVLAWGHWGTDTYRNAPQIFTHFQDHWTDNGGYSSWAYNWWITGAPPPYYVASYPDVPGGGAFYPEVNFSDYYAYGSGANMMSTIDSLMHQGYGVAVNISNGGAYLHAITCWGFEYQYVGGQVLYKSIFVTDSDDGRTALIKYPLLWQNDRWYLGGRFTGWRLASLMALDLRDLDPAGLALAGGDLFDPSQAYPTPLAPSWVLLGTGLAGLLGWRWRRGRRETR